MKTGVLLFLGLVLFLLGCTATEGNGGGEIEPLVCEKDFDCIGEVAPQNIECGEGFIAEPLCMDGECVWGCSEYDL